MVEANPLKSLSDKEISKTTWALFLIQTFSTLGFAILYSTLVLFATKKLEISTEMATALMGSFAAFNYGLHFLGGYMSGRFISNRHLFIIGMVFQLVACFVMSQCTIFTMFLGLSMFLTGCGLNVTCVNNMLTQLFDPEDSRREKAFLWNYSGMNIGFFIGFTVSGYFELAANYTSLFLFGGIGNFVAILVVLLNWKLLADKDTYLTDKPIAERRKELWKAYLIIAVLFAALNVLLKHSDLSNFLLIATGVAMWAVTLAISLSRPSLQEKARMLVFFILTMASLVFWALYQLAPMALVVFIDNNMNDMIDVFGNTIKIAPQWVQNINTVVIVFGAPFMAWLLGLLRKRGFRISNPALFATSLASIGLGFVILPLGINLADATTGLVAFSWVFWSYVLQSIGELCISPIGYAMVGKLIPKKLQGMMMGIWMMTSGVAAIGSTYISNWAMGNTAEVSPLITNAGYSHTFGIIGCVAIAVGMLLFVLLPWLNKMVDPKVETPKSAIAEL
jgi:POT family proton-dependent oligopeptide transporter